MQSSPAPGQTLGTAQYSNSGTAERIHYLAHPGSGPVQPGVEAGQVPPDAARPGHCPATPLLANITVLACCYSAGSGLLLQR